MPATSSVVFYGTSVLLAGLETDLRSRGQLEVVAIAAQGGDEVARICACDPDSVVFDLAEAPPDFAISLLRERPELLLIGVDPSSDHLVVLSGRQAPAVTTTDLIRAIRGHRAGPRRRRRSRAYEPHNHEEVSGE